MLRKLILIAFTFTLLLTLPLSDTEVTNNNIIKSLPVTADVYCLAENIYRESGAESFEGKRSVAQVVVNRMNSNQFPHTACEVIYQHRGDRYQFSWVGQKHKSKMDDKLWKQCFIIAQLSLSGITSHKLLASENALYYHAVYVHPNWKLRKVTQIGKHIFYA